MRLSFKKTLSYSVSLGLLAVQFDIGWSFVKLIINGEPKDFTEGISLEELILRLGVRKETVVAEVNRKIIQSGKRATQVLADGDQIELIQFVGGG